MPLHWGWDKLHDLCFKCERKDQACMHPDAPMHQCTNAPMYQCANAPMHHCTLTLILTLTLTL